MPKAAKSNRERDLAIAHNWIANAISWVHDAVTALPLPSRCRYIACLLPFLPLVGSFLIRLHRDVPVAVCLPVWLSGPGPGLSICLSTGLGWVGWCWKLQKYINSPFWFFICLCVCVCLSNFFWQCVCVCWASGHTGRKRPVFFLLARLAKYETCA